MKKFYRNTVVIVLSLMFLAACGGGGGSNSSNNNDPNIDNPGVVQGQKISLNVRNISGLPLDKKVSLVFAGADLVNAQNTAVTSLDLDAGKSNIELTTTSLIDSKDLTILAKAEGYVDTGATIQLERNTDSYSSNIFLIPEKTGKVKEGIFTQVDINLNNIDSDGKTMQEVTLMLQESVTTPKIEVTIPEGTMLTGDDGTAVIPTSSTIVRFDPTEMDVLDSYPGGLNVLADVSGTMEQVDFKSAAFASVVLKDDTGKKVKNFDKDITIAMQFKQGVTNGDGILVELEDTVPIWSYNEDKGTWVFEKDGIVKDLDTTDGLYDVVYQTNHLTYFNLDWKGNSCDGRVILRDLNGDLQNNIMKVVLKIKDYNIEQSFIYNGDGFIDFANVPDSRNWMLEFFDPFSGEKLGESSHVGSICGEQTVNAGPVGIGNVPVTETEVRVSLSCPGGQAVPGITGVFDPDTNKQIYPADVVIYDTNGFLVDYGIAINQPFSLRTFDDGVLSIYDLPRTFFDKELEVKILPGSEQTANLIFLALTNTAGPFSIKIGRDKLVNDITLELPEDICNGGGLVESTIEATLSCPAGNIPNTQSPTLAFEGLVKATKVTDETSTIFAPMNNGSANLRLVNDLEYKVELTHSNATIDTNITNNDATFIQAGDNKSLSLLLSDAYCSGSVATPPNTYILDGLTYTETPFINASGTIDLDDYLSPSMSTQLRYTEFSKFADNPETEISTFTDVTVSGNMTTLVDEGTNRTELNVLSDRINLTQYETDLNDMQVVSRDSFVGRFYNPGDTFYEVAISGTTFIQEGTVDVSNEFNGNLSCVIEEKLNSFSERTFTYSGDIVKVRCTLSALSTITDNITSETTFVSTRSTDLSYYKSGTSIIITNNSVCIAPGTTISDDLSECQTTFSTDKYFVESFPEL